MAVFAAALGAATDAFGVTAGLWAERLLALHGGSGEGCEQRRVVEVGLLVGVFSRECAAGTRTVNRAVQECDLLLCFGARFDDRVTGKLDEFAPHAAVVHIDIDPAELGKLRRPLVAVRADLRDALREWPVTDVDCAEWLQQCCERRDAERRETTTDALLPGGQPSVGGFARAEIRVRGRLPIDVLIRQMQRLIDVRNVGLSDIDPDAEQLEAPRR